jgi:outer membrane protein TolC
MIKKILILSFVPMLLLAIDIKDVLKGVDENLLIKSSSKKAKALEQMVGFYESNNYPKVDIGISAIRLRKTPTATFAIPPLPPVSSAVGTKSNFTGEISFVYPVFTGYATNNLIKKARYNAIKAKLETKNLKRELYLKTIKLYSDIYSLNQAIKAAKEAVKALSVSLKKANKMYDNALINLSEVYNIKAKKYNVIASLQTLKAQKKSLVNSLFYISGIKVDKNVKLYPDTVIKRKKSILRKALKEREDIKIIKKELDISQSDIKLADSKFYPSIAVVAGIKKEGNSLRLNGNGYTNADKSYIGINLKWNIFDGFGKNRASEAAKLKKEAIMLYLDDYERVVKTNIQNSFFMLKSLFDKLKAAKEQLKSEREYYKLTKGRFENALSSADELSRSIAEVAKAKAQVEQYKAKIFFQKYKIMLQAGLKYFKENI